MITFLSSFDWLYKLHNATIPMINIHDDNLVNKGFNDDEKFKYICPIM